MLRVSEGSLGRAYLEAVLYSVLKHHSGKGVQKKTTAGSTSFQVSMMECDGIVGIAFHDMP